MIVTYGRIQEGLYLRAESQLDAFRLGRVAAACEDVFASHSVDAKQDRVSMTLELKVPLRDKPDPPTTDDTTGKDTP